MSEQSVRISLDEAYHAPFYVRAWTDARHKMQKRPIEHSHWLRSRQETLNLKQKTHAGGPYVDYRTFLKHGANYMLEAIPHQLKNK